MAAHIVAYVIVGLAIFAPFRRASKKNSPNRRKNNRRSNK